MPCQSFSTKDIALAHPSGDGEQHFGLLIGLCGVAEVVPEDDGADVLQTQTFVHGLAVADEVISEILKNILFVNRDSLTDHIEI